MNSFSRKSLAVGAIVCLAAFLPVSAAAGHSASELSQVVEVSDAGLASHVGSGAGDCALALAGLGISIPGMATGFFGALGFSFALHMAALNCI